MNYILGRHLASDEDSFADFPRVCRTVSTMDFFLAFAVRGRRLVYTQGIIVLTMLGAVLSAPGLVILKSPYRKVITPILNCSTCQLRTLIFAQQ